MPREIAVLTNPAAGKGRGARATGTAVARLVDAGYRVRTLQGRDADEARDLARAAVSDGLEALVVVGGDGMVNLAVNVLAHEPTALGIIPAGTGNDAARLLGIPRTDPRRAADVVVSSRVQTIDLAQAGPAYFLCVLSAGFDAIVNERANRMAWPRGQMRYNLATAAELRTFRPLRYTLDVDPPPDGDGPARRGTHHLDAVLVAVGNGPSFGGGLRIAEGARVDDGLLDLVVFRPVTRPDLLRTYPRLFRGTHREHPAYEHRLVREVTIAAPGITAYADGERLGPLPLTVRAVPGALRVLVGPGTQLDGRATHREPEVSGG